jgi:NMD protein affecting ribosome stability and mRNA decay
MTSPDGKQCRECGVTLTSINQYASSRRMGHRICTQCHKRKSRRGHVRRVFGITLEKYNRLRAKARERCAICGQLTERLELDHCHATGQLREFLCPPCNKMLGQAGDSAIRLRAAADYLEKHSEESDCAE